MKALLSTVEVGRILEIRPDDEVFEVAPQLYWVDCPDYINFDYTYNAETQEFEFAIPTSIPQDRFEIARVIGYGGLGEQLDMLYRELKESGSISANGEWFNHISRVKEDINKENT